MPKIRGRPKPSKGFADLSAAPSAACSIGPAICPGVVSSSAAAPPAPLVASAGAEDFGWLVESICSSGEAPVDSGGR
jgi:hypothetical protein